MNAAGTREWNGDSIDLAHEPQFRLAHLTVSPATIQVQAGSWSQRLEPRVMQVLIVLARGMPDVVGRGELNARVWRGRVVGDDAVNRAVQALRRVAAEAPAPPPFEIETIPRVGYRLKPRELDVVQREPPLEQSLAFATADSKSHSKNWRPFVLKVVGALLVLAAMAGLAWRLLGARETTWRTGNYTALIDLPAGASDLSWSPDGRRVAYRDRDGDGHERIYVRDGDGKLDGVPVSPRGLDAWRPAWSPDGRTLAFSLYDGGKPCQLLVVVPGQIARDVGACENSRDPRLTWTADGQSLLFGDAPGENGLQRITALRLADGQRTVLTAPPGDSMGDGVPLTSGGALIYQRRYGWADEGWIRREENGGERVLWRRAGLAGSVAAVLPDGTLAVGWSRDGTSGLDFVGPDGRVRAQSVALGPVTALAFARNQLLVESDRSESSLARPSIGHEGVRLATVRGRILGPALLPDGRLRFPVMLAGVTRIWERDSAGAVRPWGNFTAARIHGLAPSPDGTRLAALATGSRGREIIVFDDNGKPIYRWSPHARSLNPGAWSADGRFLTVPLLDAAGWRLFVLEPGGGHPPRDLEQPGYAVVMSDGPALYAVRAGESTAGRELWRLDGEPHRLPFDVTLLDIVNWRPVGNAVWLPDRRERGRPRLVLRDATNGAVLRTVIAPGLAGPGSGLAAGGQGPVYVRTEREDPEYGWLALTIR